MDKVVPNQSVVSLAAFFLWMTKNVKQQFFHAEMCEIHEVQTVLSHIY